MQWLSNTVRRLMPTANITDFNFVSFSEEKADFSITVAVTNPSFLPIPLADVNYFLESQKIRPVCGSLTGLKAIKAHNTHVITVPISIIYNNMIDFYSSLKPGTLVPYKAGVEVILYLPFIGRFIVPVEKKSEFLMPFVPRIQLREIATVGMVSNEEVNVKVGFEVENAIGYVVRNNWLEIGAFVNGVKKKVGSLKLEGGKVEMREKGSGFFRVLVCLRGEDIVLGLWEMMRRRKGFVFEGEVDVETPMGQIKSPFNLEL
ncbi:uncharacterized protein LOC110110878 [Dendrobium catenatum]|nr:uncharacterized protein LOC110110878 [Dendrobium catenatum]